MEAARIVRRDYSHDQQQMHNLRNVAEEKHGYSDNKINK